MNQLTNDECRELAERLGICWHTVEKKRNHEHLPPDVIYYCELCETHLPERELMKHTNPNFLDPVVVLREMRKREDWPEFVEQIGDTIFRDGELATLIDVDYIDDTGLLAKAALDLLRNLTKGEDDG